MKTLSQTGDTIVEVLIATAIVGVLLAGSFTAANLSSQSIRTAQERGEAQKLASGQIEQLHQFVGTSTGTSYMTGSAPDAFCMRLKIVPPATTQAPTPLTAGTAPGNKLVPPMTSPNTSYSTDCRIQPNGGVEYVMAIQRNGTSPDVTFSIYIRWDGLRGRQESKYVYAP